jgi:hypothetical protein
MKNLVTLLAYLRKHENGRNLVVVPGSCLGIVKSAKTGITT